MDFDQLLRICRNFSAMGDAISEQVATLLRGDRAVFRDYLNPNAVDYIERSTFKRNLPDDLRDELQDAIDEYRKWLDAQDGQDEE